MALPQKKLETIGEEEEMDAKEDFNPYCILLSFFRNTTVVGKGAVSNNRLANSQYLLP